MNVQIERCQRRTDADIAARFEQFDRKIPAAMLAQYPEDQRPLIEAGTLAAWHRHQLRRMSLEGQHGLVPCPDCGTDAVRFGGKPGHRYRVATCQVCLHHYVRECTRIVDGEPVAMVWGARADDDSTLAGRFAAMCSQERAHARVMARLSDLVHLQVALAAVNEVPDGG